MDLFYVHTGYLTGNAQFDPLPLRFVKYARHQKAFQTIYVNPFQVEVFWFVTTCSVLLGYQRFRGPCASMVWTSEKLVSYYIITRRHSTEDLD